MRKLEKLYTIDLHELADATARMLDTIKRDYKHVEEHFPQKVINDLNKFADELSKELNRRENQ